MAIYKGFELNEQGDPSPWGTIENTVFKQLIDAIEALESGGGLHNSLTGLQGGSGTERYHISVAQSVMLGNTTAPYTTEEQNKLANIEPEANKYVLPTDVVQDADYNHTDNNFTDLDKAEVDKVVLKLNISDKGWDVVVETGDFTALDNTIHLVQTSSVDINATIPDSTGAKFRTRVYKSTDIQDPDVIVTTPSGQEIGGETVQIIQNHSEGFFAVAIGDHYDLVQESRGGVERKLSQSSTVISGYKIAQDGTDPNLIDIGSGIFGREICAVEPTPPNTSDLSKPVSIQYKTDAIEDLVITGIATDGYTILQINDTGGIEQTLNNVPSIESQAVDPRIAVIVHFEGNVVSAEPWWTSGQNPAQSINWLINKLGIIKEGVTFFGTSAGNLQLAHDSGTISYDGADGDKMPTNPHEQPVPTSDPVPNFILATQNDTVNFAQTVIDPTQYDVNGTLTTLAGINKVSIQRILINRDGSKTVQYGQFAWPSMQEALTAFFEKRDTFVRWPVITKVSRIGAYLILDRSCTDLTDVNTAQFIQTGLLESDSSISSGSELVTLLKALQNGNSAGGLYQIKDLVDGTDAQDATTVAQNDLKMNKANGVGTGNTQLEQLSIGTSVSDKLLHIHGGAETIQGIKLTSDATGTSSADGFDFRYSSGFGAQIIQWENEPLTLYTNSVIGLIIDENQILTAPEMSIEEIEGAGDKALTTREYVDKVAPAGWVQLGTSSVYYCRRNGIVFFVGAVIATSGVLLLGNLPTGYRNKGTSPSQTYSVQLLTTTGTTFAGATLLIDSDGSTFGQGAGAVLMGGNAVADGETFNLDTVSFPAEQ